MSTIELKNKIALFNELYEEIAGHGRNGDTELAHINKYEAAVLKAMGGSATVNTVTGLREYWDDDDPAPAPAPAGSTTVTQVSDLPEYFKPYVEELFATAQDVYEKPYVPYGHELIESEDAEGNVTYDVQKMPDIIDPVTGIASPVGKRLADVTEEQATAFGGLRDLFTQVDPTTGQRGFRDPTAAGFEEAQRLAARGARGFDELAERDPVTGEIITSAAESFKTKYMGPYSGAVTEIQIREQEKAQELQRQQRQQAARMASALGGSRYGIETALAGNLDAQLLDDIRKKGLESAYTQGLQTFQADRDAAARGAGQRASMTAEKFGQQLKGLGALQSTGETQRAIAQQPLDIGYEEFARQQKFPRTNLQELSGILRGFQVQPSTYQTSQTYKQPPSLGQQLLAAGTLGAGISKGLGSSLLGKSARGGGLMSVVPERYAKGASISSRFPALFEKLKEIGIVSDDDDGAVDIWEGISEEEIAESSPSSVRRPRPGARDKKVAALLRAITGGSPSRGRSAREVARQRLENPFHIPDEAQPTQGLEKLIKARQATKRSPSRGRSARELARQRLENPPRLPDDTDSIDFLLRGISDPDAEWVQPSPERRGAKFDPAKRARDITKKRQELGLEEIDPSLAWKGMTEEEAAGFALGPEPREFDPNAPSIGPLELVQPKLDSVSSIINPITGEIRPLTDQEKREEARELAWTDGMTLKDAAGYALGPDSFPDITDVSLMLGEEIAGAGDSRGTTQEEKLISTKADAKKGDGTLFKWDDFAPYAGAYLKLLGKEKEGAALTDLGTSALEKAQIEYYKGLGAKAKDWAADAIRKGDFKERKFLVDKEIKGIEIELKVLNDKRGEGISWGKLEGEDAIKEKELLKRLQVLMSLQGYIGQLESGVNPVRAKRPKK